MEHRTDRDTGSGQASGLPQASDAGEDRRVSTEGRNLTAICQRLSHFMAGITFSFIFFCTILTPFKRYFFTYPIFQLWFALTFSRVLLTVELLPGQQRLSLVLTKVVFD